MEKETHIYLTGERIEIMPEGENTRLILKKSGSTCGRAYKGIGISFGHGPGGVLTLDDALLIRDWIDLQIKNAVL